jgi:hypothetical protein
VGCRVKRKECGQSDTRRARGGCTHLHFSPSDPHKGLLHVGKEVERVDCRVRMANNCYFAKRHRALAKI